LERQVNMGACDRRDEFIVAAMELFAQNGYSRTGITDIAARVGVTRSLFYHYFADKQDITDAVIEWQVNDFMAYIQAWTLSIRGTTDIRESLVTLVDIARTRLLAPRSVGDLAMREGSSMLYQRFVTRSAHLLAEFFVSTRDKNGAFIHLTNTHHPRESFYVLSVGIMSLMLRQPHVDNEVIADLIIDTLHIDVEEYNKRRMGRV
jgi:AcrR family transcriptional regulator